jgi:hypothetical protein
MNDHIEPESISRPRTLTILIDEIAISDGQIDPPDVGSVISFPLLFTETAASAPDAVTVRGNLEPAQHGPAQRRDGWQWSGLLRGDGWTATWHGPRPMTGQVEVTGQFVGVMGIDATGWVRGRVTSVQVVTMFWERVDTRERWAPVLGRREYRTVDRSPRFFSDDRLFNDNPPALSRDEIGALITLDLDDVPPLRLRPNLVAGGVSASGTHVWTIDRVLPTVVRFGENGSITTHLFPGPATLNRSVWATPTGCWISGRDGTYRVDAAIEIGRRVNEAPVTVGAVREEKFLACTPTQPWVIHTTGGDPVEVETPEGSPVQAVTDGDTFVVLLRASDASSKSYRLIRIAMTGRSRAGPLLSGVGSRYPSDVDLLADPLTIAHDDTFTDITPELTAGNERHIPRKFFRAGAFGDYIWTIGHPPDRTSRSWWPLGGPTVYDRGRGQFWLLTVLDRATLQPVHAAPVLTSQPDLAQDDHGVIWLSVSGLVQQIVAFGGTMDWPVTVELSAAKESGRTPPSTET